MFQNSWPELDFFHDITNFIDAQEYFKELREETFVRGLAKITTDLMKGKSLCKKEQITNWTQRPLRQSQLHYAALDAYILVELIKLIALEGKQKVRCFTSGQTNCRENQESRL